MKIPSALNGPLGWAVVIGVGGLVVFGLWDKLKQAGEAAAGTVAGAVTGNNAVTKGTVYEGTGIVGTPAAIVNAASGGLLEKFGGWLGGKIYDVTHPDDGADLPSKKQSVGDNFYNRGVLQ